MGPNPLECIYWARSNNVPTIRGNHDNAVASHVDCGCSYVYKHLSEATREYTWAAISENDERFLRSLPLKLESEIDRNKVHVRPRKPGIVLRLYQP